VRAPEGARTTGAHGERPGEDRIRPYAVLVRQGVQIPLMPLTATRSNELVATYQKHPKDTGSCEVQVALLSERIAEMTGHLKRHPKDLHSRRGLTVMVSQRTRLLAYLRKRDVERYKSLIERLGLRK